MHVHRNADLDPGLDRGLIEFFPALGHVNDFLAELVVAGAARFFFCGYAPPRGLRDRSPAPPRPFCCCCPSVGLWAGGGGPGVHTHSRTRAFLIFLPFWVCFV